MVVVIHVVVARISYEKLRVEHPKALEKATKLLRVYSKSYPKHTEKESEYPFVECATLADDIKYKGGGWQSEWHFIDTPWFSEGKNISDYPDYKSG